MTRFRDTIVQVNDGTVEVGSGLTWDRVYKALHPTGVNVVGGRVPGVGVAGLALGGGERLCLLTALAYLRRLRAIHGRRASMD